MVLLKKGVILIGSLAVLAIGFLVYLSFGGTVKYPEKPLNVEALRESYAASMSGTWNSKTVQIRWRDNLTERAEGVTINLLTAAEVGYNPELRGYYGLRVTLLPTPDGKLLKFNDILVGKSNRENFSGDLELLKILQELASREIIPASEYVLSRSSRYLRRNDQHYNPSKYRKTRRSNELTLWQSAPNLPDKKLEYDHPFKHSWDRSCRSGNCTEGTLIKFHSDEDGNLLIDFVSSVDRDF